MRKTRGHAEQVIGEEPRADELGLEHGPIAPARCQRRLAISAAVAISQPPDTRPVSLSSGTAPTAVWRASAAKFFST